MAQGVVSAQVISAKQLRINGVLPELRRALLDEGRVDRRMLEKTVATWDKKPKFKSRVDMSRSRIFVETWTDDEVYNMLNAGTRKHWIFSTKHIYLRFRWPYKAKTTPRVIGSHAGGPGDNWAMKTVVKHPGTKARRWYEEVRKRRRKPFKEKVNRAIAKALERNKK